MTQRFGLLKTGEWNGWSVTPEMLSQIEQAFSEPVAICPRPDFDRQTFPIGVIERVEIKSGILVGYADLKEPLSPGLVLAAAILQLPDGARLKGAFATYEPCPLVPNENEVEVLYDLQQVS